MDWHVADHDCTGSMLEFTRHVSELVAQCPQREVFSCDSQRLPAILEVQAGSGSLADSERFLDFCELGRCELNSPVGRVEEVFLGPIASACDRDEAADIWQVLVIETGRFILQQLFLPIDRVSRLNIELKPALREDYCHKQRDYISGDCCHLTAIRREHFGRGQHHVGQNCRRKD
jgi:hypothetical protein